jgi:hypothetical protein
MLVSSILCRHNPSILQPKCSIKWQLPRASRSRAYATDRCSIGDAASDVTTGAKEAGVKGVCNAKKTREEKMYESHWSHGGCLISLCMRSEGRYRSLCGFQTPQKLYPTLPTMLPPPWWLRAAGPPPQARHLTGRIDKRFNFGDPATVEWQRGDISQG